MNNPDLLARLSAAIHLESAAIAPQTSPLLEAAKEALGEIERLLVEIDKWRDLAQLWREPSFREPFNGDFS